MSLVEDDFDLDQVQEWGEIALITLTQLWRQLPRIDNEAASKLSDQVVDARKSIEKLVKAACATHRNLEASDRLYEPLPYGQHQRVARAVVGGLRQQQSSPGNERGVSTFSHTSFTSVQPQHDENNINNNNSATKITTRKNPRSASGNNILLYYNDDEDLDSERQPDGKPYSPIDAVRAAAAGHVISEQRNSRRHHRNAAGDNNVDEGDDEENYDDNDFDPDSPQRKLFKTEIRGEGVPHIIFEEPETGALASSLSGKGKTAHSKLMLMVQFAERREQMWKNHAKFLKVRTELDEIEEAAMAERYDISLRFAGEREKIVSEFSRGLPIILATSLLAKTKKSKKAVVDEKASLLEGVREALGVAGSSPTGRSSSSSSPNRLKLLSELNDDEKFQVLTERVDNLQNERSTLIEEMAKLSTECTRLSRENSELAKKAQALPPGPSPELEKVTNDLAELRKKIINQSERSRSLSRTGSPAVEGGSYVPPQGGGAILQLQRSASAQQQQFLQSSQQQQQEREQQLQMYFNPHQLQQYSSQQNQQSFANSDGGDFDEEEEEEEESDDDSISSSSSASDADSSSAAATGQNSQQKKITSVADAVLMLIKRQRKVKKEERAKHRAENYDVNQKKSRKKSKAERQPAFQNNQQKQQQQQQQSSFGPISASPGAKLGNFGDDSLVPFQVLRASQCYFPKTSETKKAATRKTTSKKSSRRSTPNKTTPRDTHLLANGDDDDQQQQPQESQDPEFAELEKRNREILNRLKEEASRREKREQQPNNLASSQRSNSPYHKEGDVVSRSVAFLKKQQELEEAARRKKTIHYAFGTPVKEPLPAPTGKKPHFSKFYPGGDGIIAEFALKRSTSPNSQNANNNNNNNNIGSKSNRISNNSPPGDHHHQSQNDHHEQQTSSPAKTPSRSLGYLKWEFRKDQQERRLSSSSSRRSSHTNHNNNNQETQHSGNKTPPAPSLNAVAIDNQVRLDAEDDDDGDYEENNKRNSRKSINNNNSSSIITQQQRKQQIQVRSVGKVAQVASTASSSSLVKKPIAKPSGTKIPVPAPKQQQQQQQPKKSTTALEDLANETLNDDNNQQKQRQQPQQQNQNHLQSLVFEREVRVVVQSERAGRADILSEAANYYTSQAAALGKESLVDWLEMMRALRQE